MKYKWPCLPILLTTFVMQAFGDDQNLPPAIDDASSSATQQTEMDHPSPPAVDDASSSATDQPQINQNPILVMEEEPNVCCEPNYPQALIEVKAGYFFFANSKMRDIYDNGGIDVQLSGSYPVWRWLQVYGSVEFLTLDGKSLGGNQNTSIWEIPLSLGLKPVIAINDWVQYYATLGPRYFFVHQHNRSDFVDHNVSQNGIGGFVNTGFLFFPRTHLVIDVFGEYSYGRLHFHAHKDLVFGRTMQIGGFTFGAGLGYSF